MGQAPGGADVLRGAFVNCMPDAAFLATERHVAELLRSGAGGRPIAVDRYSMSAQPRSSHLASVIAARYRPVRDLWSTTADVVVITGAAPLAEAIEDEPHFDELVGTFEWARHGASAVYASCLAAHAAIRWRFGLSRTRLATKCSGVFTEDVDVDHPIAAGLGPTVLLPHSRWSAVDPAALAALGCRIVTRGAASGWGVATARLGACDLLLAQSHPEYRPDALVREYQRDLVRFARGTDPDPPTLPRRCVGERDWRALFELDAAVSEGVAVDPDRVTFDFAGACRRAPWPWRQTAITLVGNWLTHATTRHERVLSRVVDDAG